MANNGFGGGIYNGRTGEIQNSTVTGNDDWDGSTGGLFTVGSGTFALRNTIIAGSTGQVWGTVLSGGNNLISDTTFSSGWTGADVLNVDAMLGALAPNGGPTPTHALLPGSPAIDAPPWDQRGEGYPRIVNGTIDIGAFEVQSGLLPNFDPGFFTLLTADWEHD